MAGHKSGGDSAKRLKMKTKNPRGDKRGGRKHKRINTSKFLCGMEKFWVETPPMGKK